MEEKPSTFNKMSVENPIWSRCVPLHYPAVYFHTALIHITVSQWNPAGGRDVRGIFPQPKPRAKTSRGEEEKIFSKFKTDWTTKSRKLERFGDLPRSWQRERFGGSECHWSADPGRPRLRSAGGRRPSPTRLIRASWCPNQSPIGRPATFTSLPIVAGQNKQDCGSRLEDTPCLNTREQKPPVDIHLHSLT